MRRGAIAAALWGLAVLLPAMAAGQQKPDFSGTWKLNLDRSDYGDLQGPNSRTDTIVQHEDEITETVAAVQRHKNLSYVLHFSTDGRRTVLAPSAQIHIPPATVQSLSASWQGTTLAVTEWLRVDDRDLLAKFLYALSAGSNELTMTLFLGGTRPAETLVFERVAP